MAAVRFSSQAEEDVAELLAYVARDSMGRARALFARIQKCLRVLEQFPLTGRERPEYWHVVPGMRSIPVAPIVICYTYDAMTDIVQIGRIIDGRRDFGTLFA